MRDMLSQALLGPDAVKVDIGRANIAPTVLCLVLFGGLAAGGISAAIATTGPAVRAIGLAFAAMFGILFVVMLIVLPRALQQRGLAFNRCGIVYWEGRSWLVLGWHELAAVGIGYEQPPGMPNLQLSPVDAATERAAEKIKETIHMDSRRRVAVEIFPAQLAAISEQRLLARYRREQPAPPGPHPARWSLPLPPTSGAAGRVEHAMQTFQPQRWLGWYARPWRAI